ncbi:hypothetical protein K438DRAFT_1789174 [Mycena galopus ATCC 62051]|nr:hypothetical protein K438DRAFT_1789174 [Mycena galopus ATCC 62051]
MERNLLKVGEKQFERTLSLYGQQGLYLIEFTIWLALFLFGYLHYTVAKPNDKVASQPQPIPNARDGSFRESWKPTWVPEHNRRGDSRGDNQANAYSDSAARGKENQRKYKLTEALQWQGSEDFAAEWRNIPDGYEWTWLRGAETGRILAKGGKAA